MTQLLAASLLLIRSMELNGMQRFIMPRRSPSVSSKLISTTTSLGGTICTSCGLLSTRSTESFSGSTPSQACFSSCRNRPVIRADQPQLDLGQRPAGDGAGVFAAAQQAVDDRIEDRRVDVEDQVAFQRLGPQQVEAGRVFQAEDELAVGELIDAGQLDFDDRAQQGREGRAEVAAKAFVQRLQGPHLLLADALGPLEVVGRDLFARPGGAPASRGTSPRPAQRAAVAVCDSIALSRLSTSDWLRTSSVMGIRMRIRSIGGFATPNH